MLMLLLSSVQLKMVLSLGWIDVLKDSHLFPNFLRLGLEVTQPEGPDCVSFQHCLVPLCGLWVGQGLYVIRRINTWLVGFQRSNYSACFTMFGGSLCIKDRKSQNKDLYQHRELKNISIKYGDIKIWKEIDKAMPLLSSSLFLSFSFPFENCLCCSLKYSQPYSLTKLRKSLAPM